MPFQDVLGVAGQRVRKVDVKLHHQVPSLLGVFGEGETLPGNSLSHAGLDDIGDLHVARLPVYRRHGNRASAQRLKKAEMRKSENQESSSPHRICCKRK